MSPLLKNRLQIRKLAQDLGLRGLKDPVWAIVDFCERRVREVMREFPHCVTPSQLLDILANKLGTHFELVKTDGELRQLQQRYVSQGEKGFVRLADELAGGVYGITIRRMQRRFWEPEFVSVIDCRAEKSHREYYTKWHEIGHLLILPDPAREYFRRTHCDEIDLKDPEEAVVDLVAGRFAFFPEMLRPHMTGPVSFESIEEIRRKVCPTASLQSAQIGIVKAWPTPCLLVDAQLGLRRAEKQQLRQGSFEFQEKPQPVLRAVHVTQSEGARDEDFTIFPNMRVPEDSVIYRVFVSQSEAEARENLSMWASSDGTRLGETTIFVKARYSWGAVQALIFPT